MITIASLLLAYSFSSDVTDLAPLAPVPSARQLAWHDVEYCAFVHFNMNTFTDAEWGTGQEPPSTFAPTALDCRQWARVARDAGMKGIIITAKHHDGFCLWPSRLTSHTVASSAWRDGQGDVLRDLSQACREQGLRFGVYLSPWDRNQPCYGDSPRYNAYFEAQLAEVLQDYGEVFEVWFDGACGEGPNGKKQVYDWSGFIAVVRKHQPNAVIFSDAGPDIRWVGNERGPAGLTNWSMLRRDEFYPGIPQRERELNEGHLDGTHWLPAECDVSIRPGWYYHAAEDDKVKSLAQLCDIYFASVGRNASLLLNLPVDRRGLVHENDAARLRELRQFLDATFAHDFLRGAQGNAISREAFGPERTVDGDAETYWASAGLVVAPVAIELELRTASEVDVVELCEPIRLGQRVAAFQVEGLTRDGWQPLATGTTIGHRRWLRFPRTTLTALRVTIAQTRTNAPAALSTIALYATPRPLSVPTAAAASDIVLSARNAKTTGKIRYDQRSDEALVAWTALEDIVSWPLTAPAAGTYDVEITYACAPGSDGAGFEIRCGDSATHGKVFATGADTPFVTVPVGLIDVASNATSIAVRATTMPHGAVMSLRSITLRPGYRSLFDGKTLNGWRLIGKEGPGYIVAPSLRVTTQDPPADAAHHVDDDQVIVCPADGGGNLFTEKEYANFSFRFEFRLFPGSNNGVGIRAPLEGDAAYVGMEIQVLDNEGDTYRDKLKPWQYHGSIYGVVAAPRGFLRPTGAEWNSEEIVARGRHVTVILNGTTLVDANLDDVKDPELLAQHPGLARSSGHIGFLGHQSRVEFRNIRVKQLE